MKGNHEDYRRLPSELRHYYEKRRKGLIEERPYDSWGPETREDRAVGPRR